MPLNVLVTGATGFLGRAVILRLRRDGHRVTCHVRRPARARGLLGGEVEITTELAVDGKDAVVNLAGAPIIGRWTAARRAEIMGSRIGLTRSLVDAIAAARTRPSVLLSASAVGYYGDGGDEELDEDAPAGRGFAASLCRGWEDEAARAAPLGLRVACLRIGIVLGPEGGFMAKVAPGVRAGLGAVLGDGRQWTSWVHLADVVEAFAQGLADARFRGPINLVAPAPARNREIMATLGRVLRRPVLLRVPAVALRVALGEAAGMLLAGQRVQPRRLGELGFRFRFAALEDALRDLCAPEGTATIGPAGDVPISAYLRERGARRLLRQTLLVDAPLDEVFTFFANAENLGALTPPGVSFDIKSPTPIDMRVGATIDYAIRLGLLPIRWRSTIEKWEPGRVFIDSQASGPYRSWWHEHHFRAMGQRTVVEDRVYYSAPLGPLGSILDRLFVARSLRRIFQFRAAAVRLRFGELREPPPNEVARA
ncbi:MAG TPA: TIGR01777 family oxidoreductase [Haliangiales bacterium]|nr:TIGR01777 family oxidoreductase [Haliangiales bacterium]